MKNLVILIYFIFIILLKKFLKKKKLNDIYYSKDYEEAKKKIISFNYDKKFKEIKCNNFTLFIRQSNSNKYIIVSSGLHGNEFITGSAIQCKIMDEINKNEFTEECPNIIIVHCINKYGCINSDRFNKSNVDLNRNCLKFSIIDEHDNKSYNKIKNIFNPRLKFFKWIKNIIKYGSNNIHNGLLKGQNENKNNLYYIGRKNESEICEFFEVISKLINDNSIIFHIDIHTGFKGSFKKFCLIQDENKINFLKENIFKNTKINFINLSESDLYKDINGFLTFENNFIFLLNKYGKKKFLNLKYHGICQEFSIANKIKYILVANLFMKYNRKKIKNKLTKRIKRKILNIYNPDKYKNFYIKSGYEDFKIIFNYLKDISHKM